MSLLLCVTLLLFAVDLLGDLGGGRGRGLDVMIDVLGVAALLEPPGEGGGGGGG